MHIIYSQYIQTIYAVRIKTKERKISISFFILFKRRFLKILDLFRALLYRALLWLPNSFIKLFRALFAEFVEATWTVPFDHWRNVYDE